MIVNGSHQLFSINYVECKDKDSPRQMELLKSFLLTMWNVKEIIR